MVREHRVIAFDLPDEESSDLDQYAARKTRLANQVRSLYCACYREMTNDPTYGTTHMLAWDGDPEGRSGRKTQNVWPKIAARIIALQADPLQYVRAQFYAIKRATPPSPNTFVGSAAAAKYEAFKHQARSDLEHRVSSDLNQIQLHLLPFKVTLGWDHAKALAYVLRDPQCGASALVRYCHAVADNLAVAVELRERALLQYMYQMSDYDDVLKGRIPQELRVEAQQLLSSLVG